MLSPPTDSRKSRENPGTEDSLDGSLARELRQQFSPPRLETGQILAERYRILRHLGDGGMGDVYLAEHILAPALRSAIKILRPTVVRETSALVIREASNVAKIRHRHVVRVTDVGMPSDDMAFLVMEYVGQDLGAYARAAGGVLPPPQAVNFCAQVCDALSAAHDQRLVHRDIKPSNCLVHTEDGNDYIVVSDFGLARVLHGEDSTFSEWSMVGSKGYMAPEILSGQARPDHRVDIYSVGAMLCCLIIGAPPPLNVFSMDRDSAKEYLRPVPKVLFPILKNALAFEPKRRYSSAGEMARALRQALPLLPWETPSKAPVTPFSRTAMLVSLLGAVGLIAILAFAVQLASYLEGPLKALRPLAPLASEIERNTTPQGAVNGPAVSEAPASAPSPADLEAPTPSPVATMVSSPIKTLTKKNSSAQKSKPSVVEDSSTDPEGASRQAITDLCQRIERECSARSSMKKDPRYAALESLTATLKFKLQSDEGRAHINNWGELSSDRGFKACANETTMKAMVTRPITRGIGSVTCEISM